MGRGDKGIIEHDQLGRGSPAAMFPGGIFLEARHNIGFPEKIQVVGDGFCRSGVLHLTLPKAEEVKPKTIKVKVAQ